MMRYFLQCQNIEPKLKKLKLHHLIKTVTVVSVH